MKVTFILQNERRVACIAEAPSKFVAVMLATTAILGEELMRDSVSQAERRHRVQFKDVKRVTVEGVR
jgi:hypothetical protein